MFCCRLRIADRYESIRRNRRRRRKQMSDNRMTYTIDHNMLFPLIEIRLEKGESAYIQRGSMVYHSTGVSLNTRLNAKGRGLGKVMGALGRSLTSGESMWITQAVSDEDNGFIALAPNTPGEVIALQLGQYQYRINDGRFLAMDGCCQYSMQKQSVGKAIFAGTGGFFVMTTEGTGIILCNSFGSIKKLELNNQEITIDNSHVVAWSTTLDYDIHLENGLMQSIGNGEGIVNTFRGSGEIYIQSLNLETFAGQIGAYIDTSK